MGAFNVVAKDTEIDFIKSVLTNELVEGDFPVLYKGSLDHESTRVFTDICEAKMIREAVNTNCTRKTYHIIVEALQNISRHSDHSEHESRGNGIFLFSQDKDLFYIVTGNKVLSNKVNILQSKLDFINEQSTVSLREMRRSQMRDGSWSEKGGAGLGLIDIARKSGEQLLYKFLNIDTEYSYFLLKITVKKEY